MTTFRKENRPFKLSSDTVVAYFDAHKDIEVIVDASPVSLGAMLILNKAIAFANRALSDTET